MIVEIATSVAVAAVTGGMSWFLSISPRLTRIETKHDGLHQLMDARFDAQDKMLDGRLGRIERALNGAWKHAE